MNIFLIKIYPISYHYITFLVAYYHQFSFLLPNRIHRLHFSFFSLQLICKLDQYQLQAMSPLGQWSKNGHVTLFEPIRLEGFDREFWESFFSLSGTNFKNIFLFLWSWSMGIMKFTCDEWLKTSFKQECLYHLLDIISSMWGLRNWISWEYKFTIELFHEASGIPWFSEGRTDLS